MHTKSGLHLPRGLVVAALSAAVALTAPVAHAVLLDSTYEAQLEAWLGQGDLNFSSIFTKVEGDGQGSHAFHAAADGMGPTFLLMSVSGSGGHTNPFYASNLPYQIIGGYNPQSWTSEPEYVMTPDLEDRTAFIFNLTYSILQRQNDSIAGAYQTYNAPSQHGPVFGGSDFSTNVGMDAGSAQTYSYGATGVPITAGGTDWIPAMDSYFIHELEVYTFTPAPATGGGGNATVPDAASTLSLLGLGLLGLAGIRRVTGARA